MKTSKRTGPPPPHAEGAVDLELEDHVAPGREQPVDLLAERAVATAGEADVLEELVAVDPPLELRVVEEVVLAAVDLTLAAPTGRGGGRDDEVGRCARGGAR